MIFNNSLLKVSDNSNVNFVKCFNVNTKLKSYTGISLCVSVKILKNKGRFHRGSILKGMIIREKRIINRQTGNYLNFDSNEVILFNEKNEILNTRVFGLIPLELRRKKFLRFLTLSSYFV